MKDAIDINKLGLKIIHGVIKDDWCLASTVGFGFMLEDGQILFLDGSTIIDGNRMNFMLMQIDRITKWQFQGVYDPVTMVLKRVKFWEYIENENE